MSLQDGLSARRWKPGPRTKALFRGVLDLIFPPQTLDAGEAAPQAEGYSADVWRRIAFLDDPVCDGCGAPFDYDMGPGALCPACTARPRVFGRARAACLYDEVSREGVLQLKHGDRLDLAPLYARWISRAARDLIAQADVIVPVPMHRWRLLARRYNQAAEIARPLARMNGLAYLPDALVRARATESQGGKSGSGRRRNVAGAFAVPARKAARVAGRNVLLIDDVLTTGATAEACARALLRAGAARVDVAVVARVQEAANLTI